MPLYQAKSLNNHLSYIIWHIDESEEELREKIVLHPSDQKKLETLTHPAKIKEFLALRCCLSYHFGTNPEVWYTDKGKPYLQDLGFISFSHTQGYAGIIHSDTLEVGMDLEVHRKSIQRIAPKFLRREEARTIDPLHRTGHIIYYWGAKETLLKIEGNRQLNFKQQLRIHPFLYRDQQSTVGRLWNDSGSRNFRLYFEKSGPLYLTYGWKIN